MSEKEFVEAHWCEIVEFQSRLQSEVSVLNRPEMKIAELFVRLKRKADEYRAVIVSHQQFLSADGKGNFLFMVTAHVVNKDILERQQRQAMLAQGGNHGGRT